MRWSRNWPRSAPRCAISPFRRDGKGGLPPAATSNHSNPMRPEWRRRCLASLIAGLGVLARLAVGLTRFSKLAGRFVCKANEEAVEVGRVGEAEAVPDFGNAGIGIDQQTLGFEDKPVMQQFYRRKTRFGLAQIAQLHGRHAKFAGHVGYVGLLAIMRFNEFAKMVDRASLVA